MDGWVDAYWVGGLVGWWVGGWVGGWEEVELVGGEGSVFD